MNYDQSLGLFFLGLYFLLGQRRRDEEFEIENNTRVLSVCFFLYWLLLFLDHFFVKKYS